MGNFEAKHPRAKDGKFKEKHRAESGLELTCTPQDWESSDTELVKPAALKNLGAAGDKIVEQMVKDNPSADNGLYGPMDWTKKTGAANILEEYLDKVGFDSDCKRFSTLDSEGAEKLLGVLPSMAYQDRQNEAPTLGKMLAACAANPEKVHLSGYMIDSSRWDERISVDAIHIADPSAVKNTILSGQDAKDKWQQYREKLGLGDSEAPDEIYSTGGEDPGWTLWWD